MRQADPARGVLRGRRRGASERPLSAVRVRPPEALSGVVHHFWLVRWTAPFFAEALPHPAARILFDDQAGERSARFEGPPTAKHTRPIASHGETFGITFLPGAFMPPSGEAVARLTDQAMPLEQLVGRAAHRWQARVFAEATLEGKVAVCAKALTQLLPAPTVDCQRARELVERLRVDRELLRVDDLCRVAGLSPRTLQRLFREFVGVSPKWCIRRFRLLEVVEQLASPTPPSLAELAGALGYADQAHLTRDFTRHTGQTPRGFQRRAFD
jgi:AraC-like DNA-binding protein